MQVQQDPVATATAVVAVAVSAVVAVAVALKTFVNGVFRSIGHLCPHVI